MRVLLALLGGACAEKPEPEVPHAATQARAEAARASGLPDLEWGVARLDTPPLELELPELSQWEARTGASWTRLSHSVSGSAIELWLSRAPRVVRPEECEARARLSKPELWLPAAETTVDEHTLDAPPGYRSQVTVGIEGNETNRSVRGIVIAFGAGVGRCFAFSFTSDASGAGAEAEVARRLDLAATRILPGIKVRGVEDRVEPETVK